MRCLPLLVPMELLPKLADQFALGPGEPVIICTDDEDVLFAPTVTLDVLG
jgi:hypothetical protein